MDGARLLVDGVSPLQPWRDFDLAKTLSIYKAAKPVRNPPALDLLYVRGTFNG